MPIDDLLARVAKAYGVTVEDMRSQRRDRRLAYARFAAYQLMRDRRKMSLPQIGRMMGGRHHTTVMYGIAKLKKLLEEDPSFASRYQRACG